MSSNTRSHSWQDIQSRICDRIRDRTWLPGDLIPGEAILAEQFGCARTTVNRALRELAATGIIDRKRKAGTRVAKQPIRMATARIPIVRSQVESTGARYRFLLMHRSMEVPDSQIAECLQVPLTMELLHVKTIHCANEIPYVAEERWVNVETVPDVLKLDLKSLSLNEWLVSQVPFSRGQQDIYATKADEAISESLNIDIGTAVLTSTRTTWLDRQSVTRVLWHHAPDFHMYFEI